MVCKGFLKLLLTIVFLIHSSTSQKSKQKTYEFGEDCNVTAIEQDFGSKAAILYNGSSVNSSCDEMSFISSGKYELCYKSEKFHDPDCAVELHVQDRSDRRAGKKVHVIDCQRKTKSTFCTESNGTLLIEFKVRNNKSPRKAYFSGYVYTTKFDWELFTTVIGIVVPLTIGLLAAIIAACCFVAYRRRKLRARSAFNRNPPPGSYPTQPGSYPTQSGSYPTQPGSYPTQPGSYPNAPPPYESSFGTYTYSTTTNEKAGVF